jgi:hypothetical protein
MTCEIWSFPLSRHVEHETQPQGQIANSVATKAYAMLNELLPILFLCFLPLLYQVEAQASTISVGPLLSCTLTTFACPGVSGCCTIAGCCGGGCCANGYTCINEGTSEQACCPASDPTKCGTATSVSTMRRTRHIIFLLHETNTDKHA